MANVLTVVATIRAAPGKGDALAALLVEQAAVVRKAEPGCLVYRPHRCDSDPDLFVFYEQYVDDAAFEAHRRAPHLAQYRERREREKLTEGPVDVKLMLKTGNKFFQQIENDANDSGSAARHQVTHNRRIHHFVRVFEHLLESLQKLRPRRAVNYPMVA